MANSKILNTRICLKYDSWASWDSVKDTFTPLRGEVCVVNPGTATGSLVNTPCLMKVGDGETLFSQLPWVSAPAADVHDWAKKSEAEFINWINKQIETNVLTSVENFSDSANPERTMVKITFADNKELPIFDYDNIIKLEESSFYREQGIAIGLSDDFKSNITGLNQSVGVLIGEDSGKSTRAIATEVAKAEIGSAGHLKREIVTELPAIEDADADTIYMIQEFAGEIIREELPIFVSEDDPVNGEWVKDEEWSQPYHGYFAINGKDLTSTYVISTTTDSDLMDNYVILADNINGTILNENYPITIEDGQTYSFKLSAEYNAYDNIYVYYPATTYPGPENYTIYKDTPPAATEDTYKEYMLINGAFEQIGDTSVNLDGYATEEWANEKFVGGINIQGNYDQDGIAITFSSLSDAETGGSGRQQYYRLGLATSGVKTGAIADGAVTEAKLETALAEKINNPSILDLEDMSGNTTDYVIFNCGSATTLI